MMASIQKKGKSFYVVYRHKQENGTYKQMWEKAKNFADAKRRKAEIENSINIGSYIPPSSQTVDEFLQDFVNIYGEQKWALSTCYEVTFVKRKCKLFSSLQSHLFF